MSSIENVGFEIPDAVVRQLQEMERLAQRGVALVPPPDFIAEFVQIQRAMLGWKQDTLASFADISLSTVQRIERGDVVSANSLERVAVALGQPPGAFTEPRVPLRSEEVLVKAQQSFCFLKDRVSVPVRPLRTQPQVAMLACAHSCLIDSSRLANAYNEDFAALGENLDFLAFVLTTDVKRLKKTPKRRELYVAFLDQVTALERRTNAIALAGTYKARTNAQIMPTINMALIGLFPKSSDPGALKRRTLVAPAEFDLVAAWRRFCQGSEV